jgi:hypothetical protein
MNGERRTFKENLKIQNAPSSSVNTLRKVKFLICRFLWILMKAANLRELYEYLSPDMC